MGALTVAVVGLGFGAEFLPIYRCHPDVGRVVICDSDRARLDAVGERHGIDRRTTDLGVVLSDPTIDAVHLCTPVAAHAIGARQVLEAGKHCACAVPMGRTIDELAVLVEAERRCDRNYMMMETAVYGREFLLVEELIGQGRLGELTFLTGSHHQDLDGFPPYWWGFPPLLYATHALAPLLALADRRAARVRGTGSGQLPASLRRDYDNPFPVETATVELEGTPPLTATVTVSFSGVARTYTEGFSVYGTSMGFEWPQRDGGDPVLFELGPAPSWRRGGSTTERTVAAPDRAERLPSAIAGFTRPVDHDPGTGHGIHVESHHGGSHPHLVHEFVRSIVEHRPARVDAATAAAWCAPGICAHASAMAGGETVVVPGFDR